MAQNAKLRDQTAENRHYLIALNQKLDQLTVRAAHIGETLAAVVAHLGEDVIKAKVQELKDRRHAAHEAELEKSVRFLLDNELATLAPEDATIQVDSFIVGKEVAKDGTETRIQHEMKRLDQAGQKRYLGKKVGDEVTVEGFPSKVVITAIYTLDMAKVQAFAAKKKAEALAAAAQPTAPTSNQE